MRDYSPEYLATLQSPRWRRLRSVCFALTWGRCAVFPLLRARELDHLTYSALGREWPLRDCVPLSRFVHRRIVTPGRRMFGRSIVNPILRLAFSLWLLLDGAIVYGIFQVVRKVL